MLALLNKVLKIGAEKLRPKFDPRFDHFIKEKLNAILAFNISAFLRHCYHSRNRKLQNNKVHFVLNV